MNLDRAVNISDFSMLAAFVNKASNWTHGDFNDDAFTIIADFALLAANFNQLLPDPGHAGRPCRNRRRSERPGRW